MRRSRLASEVERLTWYHTIDLGDGVITRGMFDHRPIVDRYLIPNDLSGQRCLDVGTMDGFWAFELPARAGGKWRGLRAVLRGYVA